MEQVRTAVYFAEPVQPLIHALKYHNCFQLAKPLADLLVQAWPPWRYPIDAVVPIPLHANRLRQRGYNQSELLAQFLCRARHVTLQRAALQRVRHTSSQVGMNPVDRHANVANAFLADPALVNGKHVLLLDDVFTTGATLAAATEALLTAGAESVSGYCLARAKQR